MRKVGALTRAAWLTAASYRVNMVLSVVALCFTVLPIYFVSRALQPVMAPSIATQGGHYFSFMLVGLVTFYLLVTAVNTLPSALSTGVGNGTFEALLTTPTQVPELLAGLLAYPFLWAVVRAMLMLAVGLVLGARVDPANVLPAVLILFLIVASYLPFGLFGAALVLAFRTAGPLASVVLLLSTLLGGVYYPTQVIPSWIERFSALVPLTYGLRALRQTLLEGMPLSGVATDVGILAISTSVLMAASLFAFTQALRYARASGSLTQY